MGSEMAVPESGMDAAYERAAHFAKPRFAAKLSGAVEGYWLDEACYFYVVTRKTPGGVAPLPMLFEIATGEAREVMPLEQIADVLGRQLKKDVTAADLGTAEFDMRSRDVLIVRYGDAAYHIALTEAEIIEVDAVDRTPVLYSPDGRDACFIQSHAVSMKRRGTDASRQITADGQEANPFGQLPQSSSFSAVSYARGKFPMGLWSQDSEWFVTHRVDERALRQFTLVEHAPPSGGGPVSHVFRHAVPGETLPRLEYVAVHRDSGRIVSSAGHPLSLAGLSPFMMRHAWFAQGRFFFLDSDDTTARFSLKELALDSGEVRNVFTEAVAEGWIDPHPNFAGQPLIRTLPASDEMIWFSEADGWGHLYLRDLRTGSLKNRITQGEWTVREIVRVDEARRTILFLAGSPEALRDPVFRRLCRVSFDGSGFEVLLETDGDIAVEPDMLVGRDQLRPYRPSYADRGASPDGRHVIARLTSPTQPASTIVFDVVSGERVELARSNAGTLWTAPIPRPFEALAADGVTKLYGLMHLPSGFDEDRRYPLVDYIYPGPQTVWYSRTFPSVQSMNAQSMAELGMVAIVIDTRGMPFRSRSFHQAGGGRLHEPQFGDHAAVVEQLCRRHSFLDRGAVGMFGHSAGGYATARAMFDYPEVFAAGVSVCGNHDSRNYVPLWLNRYGGREGTEERETQSNIPSAHKLEGKLFLISGDMDENVSVAHTLALSAALIAANRDFEQLIVPNVGHQVFEESPYALRRAWDFFVRHLLRREPPVAFELRYEPHEIAAARRMAVAELLSG